MKVSSLISDLSDLQQQLRDSVRQTLGFVQRCIRSRRDVRPHAISSHDSSRRSLTSTRISPQSKMSVQPYPNTKSIWIESRSEIVSHSNCTEPKSDTHGDPDSSIFDWNHQMTRIVLHFRLCILILVRNKKSHWASKTLIIFVRPSNTTIQVFREAVREADLRPQKRKSISSHPVQTSTDASISNVPLMFTYFSEKTPPLMSGT